MAPPYYSSNVAKQASAPSPLLGSLMPALPYLLSPSQLIFPHSGSALTLTSKQTALSLAHISSPRNWAEPPCLVPSCTSPAFWKLRATRGDGLDRLSDTCCPQALRTCQSLLSAHILAGGERCSLPQHSHMKGSRCEGAKVKQGLGTWGH